MKVRAGSLGEGLAVAAFTAGPMFLLMTGLGMLYLELPKPITIELSALPGMAMLGILSAVMGLFISLPLNLLGGLAMRALADRYDGARHPLAWAMAGVAIGLLAMLPFLWSFGANPAILAFIATSAICGWLCRRKLAWVDEDTFVSPWARRN